MQIKEGSACTPIAQRRPAIKKEWVEAGNTRKKNFLEKETHQQRKYQQIKTEEGEGGSGTHTKSTQDLSENTNE